MKFLQTINVKMLGHEVKNAYAQANEVFRLSFPFLKGKSHLLGWYFFALGCSVWVTHIFLLGLARNAFFEWTPGFRTIAADYNVYLVDYVLIIVSVVSVWTAKLFLTHSAKLRKGLDFFCERFSWILVCFSLCILLFVPVFFGRLCFGAAAILLAPKLFTKIFPENPSAANSPDGKFERVIRKPELIYSISLILSFGLVFLAWYPVQFANDFMQFPETVTPSVASTLVPAPPSIGITRAQIANCLESINETTPAQTLVDRGLVGYAREFSRQSDLPESLASSILLEQNEYKKNTAAHCDFSSISWPDLIRLREPLRALNSWQAETGRSFYHHSYLYVPAVHLLKYGLSSPIPYLYGLGNTMFYSLLMRLTSPTLTGYFNTFPLAQGVGILVIVLLVFYVTRSALSIFAATAACLLFVAQSGFLPIQMAPGFNPLRYAGLVAQTASIFYFLRASDTILRPMAMLLALIASVFWNTEYALFGFVSQILTLLVQPKMAFGRRLMWSTAMTVVFGTVCILLAHLSEGYLSTIHSGLFGIGQPTFSPATLSALFATLVFVAAVSIYGVAQFGGDEKIGRIATMPIMALVMIKFLYTPSPVHLYFSLMFIAPLLLIYVRWQSNNSGEAVTQQRAEPIVIVATMLCLVSSSVYFLRSHYRLETMIEPFTQNSWSGLGETFATTTPAKAITDRVNAVRSKIENDDTVLFLSPVDYLMSFYVNPERYCGHFEITTNLTTYGIVQDVVNCVHATPKVLVVYDAAVETPCPDMWLTSFADANICAEKRLRLATVKSVMDQLKPELVLVDKVGDLSFYRHTGH